MAEPLLEVTDLRKHFPVRAGGVLRRPVAEARAVDGVSFALAPGRSLGLVGESGCGKTTTGRLVTRLLEPTSGSIRFDGREIAHLGRRAMLPLRREIQMVFQDPYSSLNPRQTVGAIVAAPLLVHRVVPRDRVRDRVRELLELVGLDPDHQSRYPSEFSGGQRQRVGIARALALGPRLLVADEPVSALDVSVQAQVVNLLRDLQRELGVSYLFIAHDLAVVRHFCTDVAVMYLGRIVESGTREQVYGRPLHPYTRALLSAVPDVARATGRAGGTSGRIVLRGEVPSPVDPPSGCPFRTRCWKAQEICAVQEPPPVEHGPGHRVACHFPGDTPVVPTTAAEGTDGTPG
jgi:oligopeptide/dipeptide ABC transporter ATP-binding protein